MAKAIINHGNGNKTVGFRYHRAQKTPIVVAKMVKDPINDAVTFTIDIRGKNVLTVGAGPNWNWEQIVLLSTKEFEKTFE